MKKHTLKHVKQCFKEQGCELLETEYINYHFPMKYICICKNTSKISLANFKAGKKCSKCGGSEKHTLKYARQCFEDEGCILLETEYINNYTLMKYICSCDNISEISFASFKKGSRCNKCGIKRGSEKLKHTLNYIKQCFLDDGCVLLENEYINNSTPMKYICECKDICKICFANFKNGQRCKKCGSKKAGNNMKHSFKYVKQCFKEGGCELLETEYIGAHIKMKYRCSCGETSWISFSSFKQGHRCNICGTKRGSKKIKGKNHYNYNPNLTDKDRERQKSRLNDIEYRIWRTNMYIRDDYTCQKCLIRGGNLNGHHVINYSSDKELRLDESNGICFCVDCHKKFHHIYGIKNNTREQLEEFLNIKNLKID